LPVEIQLVAHRVDAGLGAGIVGVAARPARHADRTDQRTAGLDQQAAAEHHRARQIADAGLRRALLAGGGKLRGVDAKAHRGPGLACRGRWRVRTGEAVAQHHLRHAEAIDHRDRGLVAALAALAERGLGQLERGIGAEHLEADQRILRARRQRGQQHRGHEGRYPSPRHRIPPCRPLSVRSIR
jgi:hypothetical protein